MKTKKPPEIIRETVYRTEPCRCFKKALAVSITWIFRALAASGAASLAALVVYEWCRALTGRIQWSGEHQEVLGPTVVLLSAIIAAVFVGVFVIPTAYQWAVENSK